MSDFLKSGLSEAHEILGLILQSEEFISSLNQAIALMVGTYHSEGSIYSCGNGGSMCDAMHFAEELTGRFRKDRKPLPALAISDPSHISCVANDFGYDQIFSRAIEAYGRSGDVLLAISTSGNSKNIINAVEMAKSKNMKTIGLLGKEGGALKDLVDIPLIVPQTKSTDRIQEIHIKLIHLFIEGIERELFPENYTE